MIAPLKKILSSNQHFSDMSVNYPSMLASTLGIDMLQIMNHELLLGQTPFIKRIKNESILEMKNG